MEQRSRGAVGSEATSQEQAIAGLGRPNPFINQLAHEQSSYVAYHDGALRHVLTPERLPAALTEFVHDGFRALVLNPKFSCVAAKSAVQRGRYRMGVYEQLASTDASAGLAHDLWTFVQEQSQLGDGFSTFVASFTGPTISDERQFEQLLWAQLQCLHDLDRQFHGWDPAASSDPEHPEFGFSFAGRAFFIVGLHPANSRWTRRFAWPTLVFNAHFQFEVLKAQGKFKRMQEVIRSRDRALQGSVNTMLSDFGERSEARQYSGRAVEQEWRCPFHAQSPAAGQNS